MSPLRVFVTGGAGFIGRAAVGDLLARGATVRCLVRSPGGASSIVDHATAVGLPSPGRLEIVLGSLGDGAVDRRWLSGCDVILHAAGALRGAASVLVRENVVATRRLLEGAMDCGVGRVVLVSSISVYAHPITAGATVDETCPVDPQPERRSAYVYSKVAQEAACRDAGVPLVVIRAGMVYGPGRAGLHDRLGPRLGRYLALIGPNRCIPATFVANCASALAAAVLTPGIDGATFNIVDDELPTARQLVRAYRESGGDVRVLPAPRHAIALLSRIYERCYSRAGGNLPAAFLPHVVDPLYAPVRVSNAAAHERLHWRPHVDLRSALRATVAGAAGLVPEARRLQLPGRHSLSRFAFW
jgi:nucleoside-diphosphate-sugar epimerase